MNSDAFKIPMDDEQLPNTLEELLAHYVDRNPMIRSVNTAKLYATVCRHMERFLGRGADVADLSDASLIAYARHRRTLGKAESTVENELIRLRVLRGHAANLGLMPALQFKMKRIGRQKRQVLEKHEILALFRASDTCTGFIGDINRSTYFGAMFSVFWYSAERITAIREVDRDADIRFRRRWLFWCECEIQFVHRKMAGETKTWILPHFAAKRVLKLLAETTLQKPFAVTSLSTYYDHYNVICSAAGVELNRHTKSHGWRRAVANHAQKAGGRAQEILGHEDERTTLKYYLEESFLRAPRLSAFLFNPFSVWRRVAAAFGR